MSKVLQGGDLCVQDTHTKSIGEDKVGDKCSDHDEGDIGGGMGPEVGPV